MVALISGSSASPGMVAIHARMDSCSFSTRIFHWQNELSCISFQEYYLLIPSFLKSWRVLWIFMGLLRIHTKDFGCCHKCVPLCIMISSSISSTFWPFNLQGYLLGRKKSLRHFRWWNPFLLLLLRPWWNQQVPCKQHLLLKLQWE